MADVVRWLVEPGVPVVLVTAGPARQRHTAHAPAPLSRFPSRVADARQPGVSPAAMSLNWDFIDRWFASFARC